MKKARGRLVEKIRYVITGDRDGARGSRKGAGRRSDRLMERVRNLLTLYVALRMNSATGPARAKRDLRELRDCLNRLADMVSDDRLEDVLAEAGRMGDVAPKMMDDYLTQEIFDEVAELVREIAPAGSGRKSPGRILDERLDDREKQLRRGRR